MAKSNTYKKDFGKRGEDIACSFLADNGFDILKKNYRFSRFGEIDLIAKKESLIIFVEVKSRRTGHFGGALYSINKRKQITIKKVAQQFLVANPDIYSKNYTNRFDLISIEDSRAVWHKDIFR